MELELGSLYQASAHLFTEQQRKVVADRAYALVMKKLDELEWGGTSPGAFPSTPSDGIATLQHPTPTVPTYEMFAELFEKYGRRDVATSIKAWFRDIEGGFDGASDDQRTAIYASASAWLAKHTDAAAIPNGNGNGNGGGYAQQAVAHAQASPNPDPASHFQCYKCGTTTAPVKRRDGGIFFKCEAQGCGWSGRDGVWRQTSWDPDSWQSKLNQEKAFRAGYYKKAAS